MGESESILPQDPAALVEACLAGDRAAGEKLAERLAPVVWNQAWRYVGQAHGSAEAEEVFQNVFVRLLDSGGRILRQFDPARGDLETYVAVLARSTALDHLRRHRSEERLRHTESELTTISNHAPAPGAPPQSDRTELPPLPAETNPDSACPGGPWDLSSPRLSAALGSLGENERRTIELLFRHGLDVESAALRLGVSPATIRSAKSHALKKLRAFLRD